VIAAVTDTHPALWYLLKNPSLSERARRFIDEAAAQGRTVVVSSVSLAEIIYLTEKKRIPASAYEELRIALQDPEFVVQAVAVDSHIVDAMRQVPRDDVPDLPDRIVAATALFFGVPVISRDGRIRASSVQTLW
jgi:PIN domain nuclease of toxin-antitoxin system